MAAAQLPQIPAINIEEYHWKQSESDPSLWQRRACGVEAIVGLDGANQNGEYDLFYSATVNLKNGANRTLVDMKYAAGRAWKILRFHQPQIACTIHHDGYFKCLLQYRAPKDDSDAEIWAERTIKYEASDRTPLDIRDASVRILKENGPRSADATIIYIAASVLNDKTPLGEAEIRFLFHSNHLFYDLIGLREMVGAFFRGLAVELDKDRSETTVRLPWDKNIENLPPAVVNAMNSDQQMSGPSYDASLAEQMQNVGLLMANHGMPVKDDAEEGGPLTLFHTFSREQSQEIIAAVKNNLGKDYTITYLAQAAVFLALLKANPPTLDSGPTHYICASPVNGRRWMQESYASGEKPYYPCAQANGLIIFQNIGDYMQPQFQESDDQTRKLLAKGAKVAKDDYARCLTRSNEMAISIPTMEWFAAIFHAQRQSGQPEPKYPSPSFASDGINDRYIPHACFSETNEMVFSIKDVHFWINQIAARPHFRLSSWRGCSRLSVDFNTTHFSQEDIQTFLNDIARYMIVFATG